MYVKLPTKEMNEALLLLQKVLIMILTLCGFVLPF